MTADRNLYWHGPLIGLAALAVLTALTVVLLWATTPDIPADESTLDEKQ